MFKPNFLNRKKTKKDDAAWFPCQESILNSLFSSENISIAILDKNSNFIKVNKTFADNDKKPPDFFPKKSFLDLYPGKENDLIFRKVRETGEKYTARSKEFIFPDGRVSHWDFSLTPLEDENGNIGGFLLCLVDANERVEKTDDLKQVDENFAAFLQHFPGSAYIKDHDGKLVYINSYAETEYKWNIKELIGKTDFDIWPEQAAKFREEDIRIMKTGCKIEKINEFIHNGKKRIHHFI
jgi:PAS domain-containing protein